MGSQVLAVPRPGVKVSAREVARIRRLRYEDGLTAAETAKRVGRHRNTVRRIAPGRMGKVPVAPVREVFERSGRSASDVARELGWTAGRKASGAPQWDGSRVRRTLGLMPDTRYKWKGYRREIDAETAGLIAEACGAAPWEVGA